MDYGSAHRDRTRDGAAFAGHDAPHDRGTRAIGGGDPASIFGIPTAELTSSVQKALKGLLGRYDDARRQLEVGREREAYLQRLCDGDVVLPTGNRRFLIRELARVIDRSRFEKTMNAFVLMSVANAPDVRAMHGEAAVHRLLRAVAAVLAPNLRASDVVASLSTYEFGIILALAGGSGAARKAEQLASAVASVRIEVGGATVSGEAAWGLHELRRGDTADGVIAAADADLLARLRRARA